MAKSTVIGKFTGKCCDSDVTNNNDMTLSRELFENLFASEDYKRAIENRYYIGFLGHPENPNCMDFRNACIVMTECHIEDNGEIVGTFDLIDTPVGQVVKKFIDAGTHFGISIRGAGDVDSAGNVDPDTFVFRGFDLVTFPAYDDCVPEFQAIAASTDANKKSKYKKVCTAIENNLKSITSTTALEVLKSQFNKDSSEYKKIESRISEIEAATNTEVRVAVLAQKLEGMTQLYLEKSAKVRELESKVVAAQMSAYEAKKHEKRFIESAKTKYSAQLVNMQTYMDDADAEVKEACDREHDAVEAADRLSKKLSNLNAQMQSVKAENLKYKQKVESSTDTISEKDAIISELRSKVNKTVVEANSQLKETASNLGEKIKALEAKVAASEQLVAEYQQAYADMYASALGVSLHNIPITSATSVEDLQKVISSSSTLPAKPEFYDVDEDYDNTPDDIVEIDSDDIVSI